MRSTRNANDKWGRKQPPQQPSIIIWNNSPKSNEHESDEGGGEDHSTNSDEYSEPLRVRSRSFSDAEDIMNGVYMSPSPSPLNGGSSVGGGGSHNEYYHEMDKYASLPQNGLHHRGNSTALRHYHSNGSTTSGTGGSVGGIPAGPGIDNNGNSYHAPQSPIIPAPFPFRSHGGPGSPPRIHVRHKGAPSRKLRAGGTNATRVYGWFSSSTTASRQWIKCCLAAGIGGYTLLLMRGSLLLQQTNHDYSTMGDIPPAAGPYALLSNQRREVWNQQQLVQLREAQLRMAERAAQRRQRTRVPRLDYKTTSHPFSATKTAWYDILLMDQRPESSVLSSNANARLQPPHPLPQELRATVSQLCGAHAQNASVSYPDAYPASAALNANSRVFITGILSPIGMQLALYLKHKCGVEVIAGMDSMYPNTVQHRLELQERIALLTTNIPKLSKPILLPYIGLDSRQKKQAATNVLDLTGEFNLVSLQPTHIVHLASYSQESFETQAYMNPKWKNTHSPYVSEEYDPPLYQLKNSMVAMEQILMGMASTPNEADRPHLVYTSTRQPRNVNQPITNYHPNTIHSTTKLVDEVLADMYHFSDGVYSVGVRLPNAVYGPWSQESSIMHGLIEASVQSWNNATSNFHHHLNLPTTSHRLDLVHVDDAVDAVVASMQLRSPSHPIIMDVSSGKESSLPSAVATIQSFFPQGGKSQRHESQSREQELQEDKGDSSAKLQLSSKNLLVTQRVDWVPSKSLQEGILRTIAWQLDRAAPFGPPVVETGDQLLQRYSVPTCAHTDITCHKSLEHLPCLSECNIRNQCIPSIFDGVHALMKSVSEGCDIVLYTQALGRDVKDLQLQGEYMDEQKIDKNDKLICNFAFVPRDSELVTMVNSRIPAAQLAKFGIKAQASPMDEDAAQRDTRLEKLNGRLLYRGWILIWVPDALEPLNVTDNSLLKLSPGRLFSSDVKRALFVEENFSVSPNIEDVQFLVGEMNRPSFGKRTIKKDDMVRNPVSGKEIKKQVKFRLPAEPPRRAAILFAPLRYPSKLLDGKHKKGFDPDKKLSVNDASKFMRYEIDLDPDDKEPIEIRRQREFYERIPSYINRNELRASMEPWYRYSLRHWVRTRWVIHDMELEESRLLRCEWYQEHVQWGTDIDQLSFAHVMAKRELERRIAHGEPDDHFKSFLEEHPQVHSLTDSYEWHAMETERNRLLLQSKKYREPMSNWLAQLPDHVTKDGWDDMNADGGHEDDPDASLHKDDVPLFVRIMSEKMMAVSRKAWSRNKKMKKKKKKK
jgi:nucleoside-diphosphate-sugar epimerase